MNYFCTFFDHRYLSRGLALSRSLAGTDTCLWVLCMDEKTRDRISEAGFDHVRIVTIDDLVRHDGRVYTAQKNRSLVEFYFTAKSFLCQYILDTVPEVDLLTYIDADLYFFGDPGAVADVMRSYSVGLTPHRFPDHLRDHEQYGKFNAGFISIRRDASGLSCLAWWLDSCFSWCHDRVDQGRFADQAYLDLIPAQFEKVVSIEHPGINLAPWNIGGRRITTDRDRVFVDEQPLILFHFHGLKKKNSFLFDSGFASFGAKLTAGVKTFIYAPYLDRLIREEAVLGSPAAGSGIRSGQEKYPRAARLFPLVFAALVRVVSLSKALYYRTYIWRRTY